MKDQLEFPYRGCREYGRLDLLGGLLVHDRIVHLLPLDPSLLSPFGYLFRRARRDRSTPIDLASWGYRRRSSSFESTAGFGLDDVVRIDIESTFTLVMMLLVFVNVRGMVRNETGVVDLVLEVGGRRCRRGGRTVRMSVVGPVRNCTPRPGGHVEELFDSCTLQVNCTYLHPESTKLWLECNLGRHGRSRR